MVFLVLAVLVTLTTVATLWLVRMRAPRENDPDSTFWYAFTGICALAPMILIPAQHSKPSSIALLGISVAAAAASDRILRHHRTAMAVAGLQLRTTEAYAEVTAQHDSLITRWCRYELDPALSIDFPAMSDVRIPETAALIRSVTAAERLRAVTPDTDDAVATYQQAVDKLGLALATAEMTARSGEMARGEGAS
ncbi:hypothetical protein [Arthrobacter sp. TWP1-1]|uniref:hypothetical protein n=1 Tax=Arthrobacter sp. TWP1-1 TaxID=2804568 RepID=UPI003CEF2E59